RTASRIRAPGTGFRPLQERARYGPGNYPEPHLGQARACK
ncbi:hypothetical protein HMPREF0277_2221, partial [Corynebacterium accolens ATCC 49726]